MPQQRWDSTNERRKSDLSEEQIKLIIDQVFQEIYAEVGRSVMRKAAWIIGVVTISLLLYLGGKDAIKLP
jgi:hypothetical protein